MARKFPLHNLRQRIDGQWEQEYTLETITVPTSADANGDYIVHLEEVPDNGDVNNPLVVFDAGGLIPKSSYPPTPGTYYVNWSTGRLAFTSTESGQALSAEYYKKGSLVEVEDINWLAERIEDDFVSSYIISDTQPSSGDTFYGQQWHNTTNGLTYVNDIIRDKWISTNRETIYFGRYGATKDQYLSYFIGSMTSNQSGIRMLRNACVTGSSVQLTTGSTCTIEIRKNGGVIPIYSFDLSGQDWLRDNTINIDLLDSDKIQVYLTSSTPIQDPIVKIEFAWRI